ncbi:hypothetical protein MKEN_00944900 [Mycena kentingensis (nom. inval.)]|nr:hypothetical protein MKEN_00944900 [Mycena kentingensis (nom. inval.)]
MTIPCTYVAPALLTLEEALAEADERQKRNREQARLRMQAYRAHLKKPENVAQRRNVAQRVAVYNQTYHIRKRRKQQAGAAPLHADEAAGVASLLFFKRDSVLSV